MFLKKPMAGALSASVSAKTMPRALLDEQLLQVLDQLGADALAACVWRDAEPDDVAVGPSAARLFEHAADDEADDSAAVFGDEAGLAVRREVNGELVLILSAVQRGPALGGEEIFAQLEDRGEVADLHLSDLDILRGLALGLRRIGVGHRGRPLPHVARRDGTIAWPLGPRKLRLSGTW